MLWLNSVNGTANYNSLVGVGGSDGNLLVIDWGLLNLGPPLDGKYNWWADASGPSGEGPGRGQAVMWCGGPVEYEPWLYVEHVECVEEHIGKFGFALPLHKCWNTFSTPIPLEQRVNTWGELLAFSEMVSKVDIAFWWDPAAQQWQQVLNGDPVQPLYGMYIKMNSDGIFLLLTNDQDVFPTRQLEMGLNLIGPNPPFFDKAMFVEDAVSSIAGVPGAGYSFVMSPAVGTTQDTWVWSGVPGIPNCPCMRSGLAYWVWMDTADTLAGFGFTPVRTLFPEENDPCAP
jgi:hypothetical protein